MNFPMTRPVFRWFSLLFLLALSFVSLNAKAQNCTVNAGVPESICPGQSMILKGSSTGLFYGGYPVWSQVSGPAVTIGAPTITPNSNGFDVKATVTGYAPGNSYTFRISTRCADGTQVFQDVVFTTLVASVANAGSSITSCPGNITLSANTPVGGETGSWSIITRPYGITINTPTSPTSTATLPTDSTSVTTFQWTILNPNGCSSVSSMTVTNTGGNPVISAGSNQTLSNCYNLTQNTNLFASYGGNGTNGQQGTWSYISGPSTPVFSDTHSNRANVSNLVTGTYILRWTVVGPCASGSAQMQITVPAPTQSVTNASNANLVFCDGRTSTVLTANAPSYTNETGVWTVNSGSGTITDPSSPSTTITGLAPNASSSFRYTITNTVTGCTSAGDFNITYSAQAGITSTNGSPIILTGTATGVSIPFTTTGGNQTQWQLVTGPLGATIAVSGTTNYQFLNASPLVLTGLDKVGTYTIRLLRTTVNAGYGGCVNGSTDVAVITSLVPTIANAGTTGLVACDIYSTTLAGNTPSIGTGYWSQISGPNTAIITDIYNPATSITGLANGSYTFRWIISAGQGTTDAQSDVVVKVADVTPTVANAGTNLLVCNQTPITLSGNTPALNETGTWTVSPSSGVTFVNANDPHTKVTGLAANTSYSFTWTIANSCGSSFSSVNITTSSTAGPKQAIAGILQCLASGVTTISITGNAASGAESGTWNFVSGPNTPTISNPLSASTTVTGTIDGTYKFEWALSTPTCTATRDTVTVTASAAATTATVTTTPVNLCGVTATTLAGNTPVIGIGTWTQVGGPGGAVITNPSSPTSGVTGLQGGSSYIFRWTITNGACASNSADVKYNISTTPTAATVGLSPTQNLCGVTSTVLTGNTITVGTGIWSVQTGPNTPSFSSFTNPTATVSGLVPGTYTLKWTSSNGPNCPSSISPDLTLNVTQNATASVSSTGLCAATVVQLAGNAGSVGTWTTVSGSGVPTITTNSNNTAIATGLINGAYTFRYTIAATGACAATSATVSITISGSPSVAQAGIDQTLCGATFTAMSATTPAVGTGTWSVVSAPTGSTASFTSVNSPSSSFINMIPGVYLLQWNVTNGNCGTNQDIVRITASAVPTTSVAGSSQFTACTGNLQLNANTPTVGVGTWSQVSGFTATIDAPNSPSTAVLGTIPGSYSFMWTIASGTCASSTSVVAISVSSTPPHVANAGPDQQVCNTGASVSTTLAGNATSLSETGSWTIASKPAGAADPTFVNANLNNTVVNGLLAGTYQFTWTLSNGSCTSFSSVNITVTNSPTPSNAGFDQTICLYSPVTLAATAVTSGVGTWSVTSQPVSTPAPVFNDVNSNTTGVNGLLSGDYVFTWITTSGSACASSMSSVTIHIVPPPTPALAGSFQTVCLGVNPVMTANSPTVGTGTWAVITSAGGTPAFSNTHAYNTPVTGLVAGVYTFSWTISSGGCTSSDQMQVTVQPALANNTISAPQIICSGSTPVGLTGTSATGGDGTSYAYQWQLSTTNGISGFADISGATSLNYSPGSLTTTTWYRRNVTSGSCNIVNSSTAAQITVQPVITGNTVTVPITATFCQSGDPAPITGGITSGGDGASYNYQWQQSTTSAGAGFSNISPAATAANYDPATLNTTTWFRRVVTSGACTNTSTAGQITIIPYATLTSIQSPAAICNGTTFSYSPTGSISGTTFAWTRAAIATINANASGSGSASISEILTSTDVVPVPVQYLYSLTSNGCTNTTAFSVTVNVNPTPTVNLPSNQVVCNGTLTTGIVFTGSPVAGTVYNWTNTTTSIGLAASGSGTINAFTAVNITAVPVTATIVVTPVSNTCNGAAQTFTIVVNPTPAVTAMVTSACTGASFVITPTNGTNGVIPAGTTFSWPIPTSSGVTGGASGTGVNINGSLSQTTSAAKTTVYIITPNTSACGNGPTFTLTVTINPVAVVTDMTTVSCAGVTFSVTPTDVTNGTVPAGTKYAWSAPSGSGFSGGAGASNVTNINGKITNTVSTATTATYTVTPTSGTCVGAAFSVTVSLNPKAIINPMSAATCSGIVFALTPADGTNGIMPSGTTFTWLAPTGTGISGGLTQSISVTGITATLSNTTNIARTATYLVTPLSGGCTGNVFSVTVTVNPVVNINAMTQVTCTGVLFGVTPTNGINGIVPAGTNYTWATPALTGLLTGGAAGSAVTAISGTLSTPGTVAETATYTVTPNTAACGNGATFTITVSVNPVAVINQLSTVICGGQTFGFTPANGTDGSIPAGTKYTWAVPTGSGYSGGLSKTLVTSVFGTLTNTVNTATTATYFVTPQSPGACNGTPFTVTISINPKAQLIAMTAVICNGGNFTTTPVNGGAFIIPAGTTYTWAIPTGTGYSGGASGAGAANISGTLGNSSSTNQTAFYTVIPLSGSCTGTTFTITVTVNPVANIVDMTAITCSGVSFTASPTNGINGTVPAGTLYSWSAPAGTGFTGGTGASLLPAITGTLVNTTTSAITANYTVTPLSGSCTGTVFSVTLTVNPSANITPMSTVTCSGVGFTVLPADGTNGRVPPATTYSWSAPTGSGFTGGISLTGQTNITGALTNTTNSTVTATYTVTPLTGGCTGAVFTVTVNINPLASVNAMTTVICTGGLFTVIPVNGTNGIVPAGATYTWPAPTVTGTLSPGAGGTGTSISGTLSHTNSSAQTATYIVTPNTAACGNGATFTVTVIVSPVAAITTMSTTVCAGLTFTVTPLDVNNGIVPAGTKYAWSLPTGTGFTGGATATNVSNISGTLLNTTSSPVTATYTVTPTSGSCTGGTFTLNIIVNPKAQITAMSATICSGGLFTVTPTDITNGIVPSGSLYTWSVPTGISITGGTSGTTAANISGTLANTSNIARTATYSVTPVSGTCNGNTLTVTITVNPVAFVVALTATTCSGTAFTLSPVNGINGNIIPAGVTYSWTVPLVTGGLSGGISAIGAGSITGNLTNSFTSVAQTATYTVTPSTAACGNGASFTVTVSINPVAAVNTLSTTICSGTSFNFTPTDGTDGSVPSGTTYKWTLPTGAGITGGASQTVAINHISGTLTNTTNAAATETYTVTPTSGSCTGAAFTAIISVSPKATITAITNTICSGLLFTVTPANVTNGTVPAGTTYTWGTPTGVSISNGFSQSTGVSSITGTLNNTSNIARTATYIVTPTSGNCAGSTFTVTVTVSTAALINPITATICSGAGFTAVPVNVTNGIVPASTTYSWSLPTGTGFTGGASGTAAANVSGTLVNTTSSAVTVTYLVTPVSGSCTGSTFSVTVTVNPVASINALTNTVCSGATFTVIPTDITNGKVPSTTTYTWSVPTGSGFTGGAGAGGAANISGTLTNSTNSAQTATYIVTPLSGTCTGTTFTVTISLNPIVIISGMTNTICSGATFTSSPTNITNGTVPAGTTYSWSIPTVTGGIVGGISATGAVFISGTLTNPTAAAQTATYTVTPNTSACGNGTAFTVLVTVNPMATITDMTGSSCAGQLFIVTPANVTNGTVPAGTKYAWAIPTGTGFTGGASQTLASTITGNLTNTTSSVTNAIYTVTPTSGTCVGNAFTVTVTLNPKPIITAFTATICSNVSFNATPLDIANGLLPAGTTYTWTSPTGSGFAGGASQTSGVSSFTGTLINTTNSAVTATYLVTPVSGSGCAGSVFSVTVTVNPVATVTNMTSTICSGAGFTLTPANLVNGIVPTGTTYSWALPIGSGFTGGATATGASNISGTLTNTTTSTQIITYLVTPTTVSCGAGIPFTVIVTINPASAVNALSTTICSGSSFNFSPTDGTDGVITSGTTYKWTTPTGSGITGGISQPSATNHIFGTLTNTTNAAVTETYIVIPTSASCTGNAFTVTVTVNPMPSITAVVSTVYSGSPFTVTPANITNGIVPAGTTYTWLAPTGTGFTGGLSQATGVSSITGLLTTATNVAQSATYIVTPVSGSCTGASFTLTITISSTAVLNAMSTAICTGTSFTLTPTNGTDGVVPAGTTYSWSTPTGSGFTNGASATGVTNISGTLFNTGGSAVTATYIVTPVSNSQPGSTFTVTVTVNPTASITAMTATSCSGTLFTATPANIQNGVVPSGTTYSWLAPTANAGINGGLSGVTSVNINGTLINTTNGSLTATYTVTPTAGSCAGTTFTVTVTVTPVASITAITDTINSGATFTETPSNGTNGIVPAGTTYSWSVPTGTGFTGGTSGTGASNISGTLTNTTSIARTATYIVTPTSGSCVGTPFTVTITVNPIAVITGMSTTICSGTTFTLTPTDGTNGVIPAGTTYSWSVPTGTGFSGATSGTGSINISGTLVNTTNSAVTATYIVTPLSGSSTGTAFTVTVTVNPTASITSMTAINCSGTIFTDSPINNYNGIVPSGTTYSWPTPTMSAGINGGLSGVTSVNITGTLVNTTNGSLTATYTVTPTAGSCAGATFTVTVTVTPVASISAITDTKNSGATFTETPSNGTNGIVPAGTTYSWSVPTGTGFTGGTSGTGASNISGTLTNTTSIARTATYIVTPTSGSCVGSPFTVTITVNPVAVITGMSTTICSGTTFTLTPTDGTNGVIPAGTTYSWSLPTGTGFSGGTSATGLTNIGGTLINTTSAAITVTYIVTPLSGSSTGSTFTVTITVNPVATVTAITTTTCSGTLFAITPANNTNGILPSGTTYSWTVPIVSTGITGGLSGIASTNINGTLVNTTNGSLTATYIVSPATSGCSGTPFTVTVTITPVASITAITDTKNSGATFTETPSNSTNGIVPAGTTYSWSAPTGTGFTGGTSGTGASNISGTLINTTSIARTATYIVTPISGSCVGAPFTITISINPAPGITGMSSTICSGASFTVTPTDGINGIVPAGTIYSWPAPTGTGFTGGTTGTGSTNIAGTLFNTTNATVTATYTVTPVSGSLTGTSFTVLITVNPKATVTTITAITCSGTLFAITPVSTTNGIIPSGTTYSWSVPLITGGISGGLSGTALTNINGVLTNPTNVSQTATYTVTPTAGSCPGTSFTVTVTVGAVPSITAITDTIISGATFTETPTNFTNGIVPIGTTYSWSTPTGSGFTGGASQTTGVSGITGTLTNTTTIAVTATYIVTPIYGSCVATPFTVTITITPTIIPVTIHAVNDDYTGIPINGAKGATTPVVLLNDTLNNALANTSTVNFTLIANGGITGLAFDSTGALVIPSNTFEGTYSITYRICAKANPTYCDQAVVTVKIVRGLLLTATAVCRNDVPYVQYTVQPNFTPSTSNPVTATWLNGDKTILTAQPVAYGLPLTGEILWPGAILDAQGNPIDWPGWYVQNGIWIQGADGFEKTRPNAYIVISVNPTDTIQVSYPPATPACNAVPTNHPPVAVNDSTATGSCSAVVVSVLNNDSDFENGILTVSLPSAITAMSGTAVVNTNGTVTYTPASGFYGIDSFSYKITDPAGLTATATVRITVANTIPVIPGGITGPCALPKDSAQTYTVAAATNAASYRWTLPVGWTGSSTTNSITIIPGATNGTISVAPVNASGCAGPAVTYQVSVIDYARVTIGSSPGIVKGDANSTSTVTIQLFDVNGNPIHCSGGIASLCTSSGVFTSVVDNNDGTYTSTLRSSADTAVICGTVGGVKIKQTVTTVFTGPQGSISGNGPIFETETPLLTFNFTAGVGPFTVVYKAGNNTKNDTLTNVTSNVAFPVKSISQTTLYRMVSIIGTDNARRDDNFIRDTATIIVVEPKIIVTLTADNPKFLADNLYATILRVKVKNIGDINLSSVQVKASLKDVFPNPVQFVLDSVLQSGVKTIPNKQYDGIQNLDLFSWNSTPGRRTISDNMASVVVPITYGSGVAGNNTSNTGLNSIDGEYAANKPQVDIPFLPNYNPDKTVTTGTEITGSGPVNTPFFFGTLSKLDAGVESDMQLYVRIVPNGYYQPFLMQVVAVGTGNTAFGTALANSLSNDDGNTNHHPEITGEGDPLPTVITVFPNPVLGVALQAATPVLQGDGTYNVALTYTLQNYGNVNLRSVNLYNNLLRSIGAPADFQVIGIPVSTDNLFANPNFDAKTDTNLLAANSLLGVNVQSTVQLTINIKPNQLSALYRLQAIGTGFCVELTTTVTDLSTNGTNPDPDGNLVPDEKLITIIPINIPIPPLIPGTIGIKNPPSPVTVLTKGLCVSGTVVVIPTSLNSGGVDPYTYQWQSSADNITFTNIPNATDSIYASGTISSSVYLRRTVVTGNQQANSNSVYVQVYTPVKPVITASGLNLAQTGTITLTSTTAVGYLWSTSATTQAIVVTTAGGYTVTITDTNGCTATSDVMAINPPPPTTVNAIYIIGATTNPPNSGIQVTGLQGATLNYYTVATNGTQIVVPVLPNVIGVYTYYVSQTVNGYESVRVPYTVTMLDPNKVADVEKVLSQAPVLQSDGTYLLSFTIISSNLRSELLDSVKVRDDLTKVFPSFVTYNVVSIRTTGKLLANELYNGVSQPELLSDGSQMAPLAQDTIEFQLRIIPNGFAGQLNNVAVEVAKSPYGTFSVSSNDPTAGNGTVTREPTKFVIPIIDIFIPSGFSPNRDGVNDYFVISHPYNTSIGLEISNRWGNVVYRSRDYKNDWDGRGNQPGNVLGDPLPDGTYYYIVTATDKITGAVRQFVSFITLKR